MALMQLTQNPERLENLNLKQHAAYAENRKVEALDNSDAAFDRAKRMDSFIQESKTVPTSSIPVGLEEFERRNPDSSPFDDSSSSRNSARTRFEDRRASSSSGSINRGTSSGRGYGEKNDKIADRFNGLNDYIIKAAKDRSEGRHGRKRYKPKSHGQRTLRKFFPKGSRMQRASSFLGIAVLETAMLLAIINQKKAYLEIIKEVE